MITMVNPLSGLHSIRVIELVFCNGGFLHEIYRLDNVR